MFVICGLTTAVSLVTSLLAIYLQVRNYRKPFEQRLIVRILAVVPLFAVSCYLMLLSYSVGRIIEPIREIYEAFVIYTFYKLLVLMLGGERRIILMTVDKPATSHPFPNSLFLKKVNISDPKHFLTIKRCILQYVWVKPLLYLIISVTSLLGIYDINDVSPKSIFVWIGIFYNMSVTISLYSLAMFWKCLYNELRAFHPWRKFLCVKLIIFASYWQGLIVGVFAWLGVFQNRDDSMVAASDGGNLGIQIQNGLLCLEMVFFAWLHWNSFPYSDFTARSLPDSARMQTWAAMKDWTSIGDLLYDLKVTTMYGDSYNLRNFDSLTDSNIYNGSDTFNQKIYQGLRVSADGKKYWIGVDQNANGAGGTSAGVVNTKLASSGADSPSAFHDTCTAPHRASGHARAAQTDAVGIHSDNIENQAKILLGTPAGSVSADRFGSTTPLLHQLTHETPTKQPYLSTIDDLFADAVDRTALHFDDTVLDIDIDIDSTNPLSTTSFGSDLLKDEKLYHYVKNHYIADSQINYPVEYEYDLHDYSARISRLREEMERHGSP